MTTWICSQFGARESYAVARALHRKNKLLGLYTDIWGMANRYSPELRNADVHDFTKRFLLRKLLQKTSLKLSDDDDVYDRLVARQLRKHRQHAQIFFAYSYASLQSLQAAKDLGYKTVLGQINPGPAEAEIVSKEFRKFRDGKYPPTIPDDQYWARWEREIALTDLVMVNSEWSRRLLIRAGVHGDKVTVVPLAYEAPPAPVNRSFVGAFNKDRPLRLLYLGGIGIRKGFHILVEAMRLSQGMPVHLDVVGNLKGPAELIRDLPSNVTWHGHVSNERTKTFYENADAMIFPTLSDGFGLTQLEAQNQKLPLIVSENCGSVVTDGTNGILLKRVDPEEILRSIRLLIDDPLLLQKFSHNSVLMADYSLSTLAENLVNLEAHPALVSKR